jgi:hypothetical protein
MAELFGASISAPGLMIRMQTPGPHNVGSLNGWTAEEPKVT